MAHIRIALAALLIGLLLLSGCTATIQPPSTPEAPDEEIGATPTITDTTAVTPSTEITTEAPITATGIETGTEVVTDTAMPTATIEMTDTEEMTETGEMTETTGVNTVAVELIAREIRMPQTLPAGPTEFVVTNSGDVAHNFEIEGQGIEQEFEQNLQPGQSETMQVDLMPGEYTIYCPVDGHRAQGMELTLTVTEES